MNFCTIIDGMFQVTRDPVDGAKPETGRFAPTTDGAAQFGAWLRARHIDRLTCSSTTDFPDEGGLAADFDVERYLASVWSAAEAPERAFERAVNRVLDAANEWETDPDDAGNRGELCAAVRAWRKASHVLAVGGAS